MGRPLFKMLVGALAVAGVVFLLRANPDLLGRIRQQGGPVGLELAGGQEQEITGDQTIVGDLILKDDAVLIVKGILRIRPLVGQDTVRVRISGHGKLVMEGGSIVPADAPDSLSVSAKDDALLLLNQAYLPVQVQLWDRATLKAENTALSTIIGPTKLDPSRGAYGGIEIGDSAQATFLTSVIGGVTLRLGPGTVADLRDLGPQKYADFSLQKSLKHFDSPMNLTLKRTTVLADVTFGPSAAGWSLILDPAARVHVYDSLLQSMTIGPFTNEKTVFKDLTTNTPIRLDFRGIELWNVIVTQGWGFYGKDSSPVFRNSEGLVLSPSGSGVWSVEGGTLSRVGATQFTGELRFKDAVWTDGGRFADSDCSITGSVSINPRVAKYLTLNQSAIKREYRFTSPKPNDQIALQVLEGTSVIAGLTGSVKDLILPLTFNDLNAGTAFGVQKTRNGKTSLSEITLTTSSPIGQ